MGRNISHSAAAALVAALVWLALPTPGHAEPDGGWQLAAKEDWNSLSSEEQRLLQRYRNRWSGYSEEEQQRLREGAQRYQRLSPEEQRAVVRERQRFERLPPEERRSLRERYRRSRDR